MDEQNITEQIVSNSNYTLQLSTQGAAIILKLKVKVSKYKTDIYKITLNSLKNIDNLDQHFDRLEDFKQYIKDISNIEV